LAKTWWTSIADDRPLSEKRLLEILAKTESLTKKYSVALSSKSPAYNPLQRFNTTLMTLNDICSEQITLPNGTLRKLLVELKQKLKSLLTSYKYRKWKTMIKLLTCNPVFGSKPILSFDQVQLLNSLAYRLRSLICCFRQKLLILHQIRQFFNFHNLNGLSLFKLWTLFTHQANIKVSFKLFRQLSRLLGLRYLQKRPSFDNSFGMKQMRIRYVDELTEDLLEKYRFVYFFDVTSFSETSLKKRNWSYPENPTVFTRKFTYDLTHLMLAINPNGDYLCKFVKGNMNSEIIESFFIELIDYISNKNRHFKLTLVLDNSPLHRTAYMKKLSIDYEVKFMFIPPKNPFFNMAEFCFRYLKSKLRTKTTIL